MSKVLYSYMSHYVNIIFLGDLNSQTSENYVYDFCNVYSLSNLVKEPTCFKNPDNPFCIDLFLTNRPKCFQCTLTMETGIPDFHIVVITVLKIFHKKQNTKITHDRSYKTSKVNPFHEEPRNK